MFFFQNRFQGKKLNLSKALSKNIKETHLLTSGKLDNADILKIHGISFMSSRPCKMGPKWGPHNSTYNRL